MAAAVLLLSVLSPTAALAADSAFIQEIGDRYAQLELKERQRYEETLAQSTRDYETLRDAAAAQQKLLEQLLADDLSYLTGLFQADVKQLETQVGSDYASKNKLQEYRRQADPSYSTGLMWAYKTASDKSYSTSAHWSFAKQIDPAYSTSAMWTYKNEVNPSYSTSTMWHYKNTVNPSYSTSTMWKLRNEANPAYSTGTMWSYKQGNLSRTEAARRMDTILTDGQASLQKTYDETVKKLTDVRKDTLARVTETRDKAVATILERRAKAVEGLQEKRERDFGGRLTIRPLQVELGPLDRYGIEVIIDGERQSFEQPPVKIEGNTMVPMRAIFERLGAEVKWNNEERSVTAVKGGTAIYLAIDSRNATVNGKPVELVIAAQLVDSNTMVPIRFVSEALEAKVDWIDATQTVVITTKP